MPSPRAAAPSPLVAFALGLLAALAVGAGGVVAALALAVGWTRARARPFAAGVVAGALLALTVRAKPGPTPADEEDAPAPLVRLDARVVAATPPGPLGARVHVETLTVEGRAGTHGVALYLDGAHPWRPRPGQQVRLATRLHRPPRATNPGAFDRRAAAARRGIAWHAWLGPGDGVRIVEPAPLARAWLSDLRHAAARRLDRVLGAKDAGLARALILGDRTHVDPQEAARFRSTGQGHVLAVSGLHVGLLLTGTLLLVRAAGLGTRSTWLVGLLVLAVYVPLAGAPPSAVRAGLGAGLYLLGRLLNRLPSSFTLLAAVVALVLLLSPRTIDEGAFRLSVAAVSGILLLTPRLQALLIREDRGLLDVAPRPRAPLRRLLAVSCGAWLGVAPFAIAAFGRLALAGPLLSVLTVPLATLLVGLAFVASLAGDLPLVGDLLAALFHGGHLVLSAALRAALAAGLGATPAHVPHPAWHAAYLAALLAAGRARPRLAALGALAAFLLLLAACLPPARNVPAHPRLTLLDVGHGQAAVLEVPDGRVALLDCGRLGEARPGRRVVAPALRALAVDCLDLATVSHEDRDHLSGIPAVHADHPILRLVVPPAFPPALVEGWTRQEIPVRVAAAERTLLAGRWGRLEVLEPTRERATGATSNDRSLVLRLAVTGSGTLILPGDVGRAAVEACLERAHDLVADVLVLPHHGLPAPGVEALRRASGARTLLASCGRSAVATLPPGTRSTAREGALRVDFLPGGPRVTACCSEEAAQYDAAPPMPSLPASTALPPWVLPAGLLLFAVVATRPLRWLTPAASAAAWVLGTTTAFAFGPTGLAALFAPFLVATLLGRLPGAKREGARRWVQVAANGFAPWVGALLALLGHAEAGVACFLGGLAALGADTCATEVGLRLGGRPRHVLSGRELPRGESGGVTAAGLLASVGGAALAPAAWMLADGLSPRAFGLVVLAGTAAALLDSVLGATLQYRGRDPSTGEATERRRGAHGRSVHVAGLRWLDNDGVNLAAGLAGAGISWGLLGWLA